MQGLLLWLSYIFLFHYYYLFIFLRAFYVAFFLLYFPFGSTKKGRRGGGTRKTRSRWLLFEACLLKTVKSEREREKWKESKTTFIYTLDWVLARLLSIFSKTSACFLFFFVKVGRVDWVWKDKKLADDFLLLEQDQSVKWKGHLLTGGLFLFFKRALLKHVYSRAYLSSHPSVAMATDLMASWIFPTLHPPLALKVWLVLGNSTTTNNSTRWIMDFSERFQLLTSPCSISPRSMLAEQPVRLLVLAVFKME